MLRSFATAVACACLTVLPSPSQSLFDQHSVRYQPGDSGTLRVYAQIGSDATAAAERSGEAADAAFGEMPTDFGLKDPSRIQAEDTPKPRPKVALSHWSICRLLENAAADHDLPVHFFARLIWQESRFKQNAVSHAGAQGIAQFMPGTANERGLDDPFDPVEALPKSAEFLRELLDQFGSLGLAAAAYNGGPGRVQRWLEQKGNLPSETRNYVRIITGFTAEEWRSGEAAQELERIAEEASCERAIRTAVKRPKPVAKTVVAKNDAPKKSAAVAKNDAPQKSAAAAKSDAPKKNTPKKNTESAARKKVPVPPPAPAMLKRPWGVQLAAYGNAQRAAVEFKALQKKYPKILADHKATIVNPQAKGKKPAGKALVRIAKESREKAVDLCTKLKKAGGECIVLKNPEPADVRGS